MDGHGAIDDGIVHFRVGNIVPNPLRQGSDLDAFMLNVVYVNHPAGTTFGLSSMCYARFQRAVDYAIESQLVYWVDWSTAQQRAVGTGTARRELDLLLEAIVGRQVIIDTPPQVSSDVRRGSLVL